MFFIWVLTHLTASPVKTVLEILFGRIWDYDLGEVVNTFENHNTPDKGVSKLCLLNELDDSLLLVGSSEMLNFLSCILLSAACNPASDLATVCLSFQSAETRCL